MVDAAAIHIEVARFVGDVVSDPKERVERAHGEILWAREETKRMIEVGRLRPRDLLAQGIGSPERWGHEKHSGARPRAASENGGPQATPDRAAHQRCFFELR